MKYLVQWVVTIEAKSFEEAAAKARDWGTSPDAINIDRDCACLVSTVAKPSDVGPLRGHPWQNAR